MILVPLVVYGIPNDSSTSCGIWTLGLKAHQPHSPIYLVRKQKKNQFFFSFQHSKRHKKKLIGRKVNTVKSFLKGLNLFLLDLMMNLIKSNGKENSTKKKIIIINKGKRILTLGLLFISLCSKLPLALSIY